MATSILSFSSMLLTRRRCWCCLSVELMRVARWEKSTSRSWGGTSSCTTPRTSIRDAAKDAAVAMPFL
nr:unnamed protein product [Digitaria exilis]